MSAAQQIHRNITGIGQLTLVEHALCPLDAAAGLTQNLVHSAGYRFSDAQGKRQTAHARILCPLGLTSADELYLWGLLALTMTHAHEEGALHATPHWCLRQLGLIDPKSRRGGRQYRRFAESLARLSTVSYLCDHFYDPARREHRRVSFGFLSYSLPLDPDSNRAWRITWDPVFYDVVKAAAGHFRFDLDCYRRLSPASRRLFLFAGKIFSRRRKLHSVELRELAINLLGYSPSLATRNLKIKVLRCTESLQRAGVLGEVEVVRTHPGRYRVSMERGAYFVRDRQYGKPPQVSDGPLCESLRTIGFDAAAAERLLRRYPHRLLAEWADITQAAAERFGRPFFKKSPMAYFVDSVANAAKGIRTPPDWWRALAQAETPKDLNDRECHDLFERIRGEVFGEAVTAGQGSEADQSGLTSLAGVIGNLKH